MVVQSEALRPVVEGIDYFKQLTVPWGEITAVLGSREGDDDVADLLAALDVPVGLDDPLQGKAPIDDRAEPSIGDARLFPNAQRDGTIADAQTLVTTEEVPQPAPPATRHC